jgi:hypothetical protein
MNANVREQKDQHTHKRSGVGLEPGSLAEGTAEDNPDTFAVVAEGTTLSAIPKEHQEYGH